MKNFLCVIFTLIFTSFISLVSKADEGMWLLQLLEQLNEKEMKAMGMKISAKDIYNTNKSSLKDAIVLFGRGCTGEVVSNQGMIFTNHHCGSSSVAKLSTIDKNYIKDGFWANNKKAELPCEGLKVSFLISIADVSKQVLANVTEKLSEKERQSLIDKNIHQLKQNTKKESYQDIVVKAFYEGNQYFLFITETYNDIRLVGVPPSSLGNFGQDTDNWMWPRHTADFSIFRIYADKNNHPAEYATDNVPYKPKKSMTISLKGVKENDFTMVLGYPASTQQYIHSSAVREILENTNPQKIKIRTAVLDILNDFMRQSDANKLFYIDRYSGISNAWKKWQGEVMGLKKSNAVDKKINYENAFQDIVNTNPNLKTKYAHLLSDMQTLFDANENVAYSYDIFNAAANQLKIINIDFESFKLVNALRNNGQAAFEQESEKIKTYFKNAYEKYNPTIENKIFKAVMKILFSDKKLNFINPIKEKLAINETNMDAVFDSIYDNSVFANYEKLLSSDVLSKDGEKMEIAILQDPLTQLLTSLSYQFEEQITPNYYHYQVKADSLQRIYMQAQMEVFKDKRFYPDANFTMRISYGKVKGYTPRDAVEYEYQTHLKGMIEKYIPGDYEFDLAPKIIDLYNKKDFGRYASNGTMPSCFIAMNHTSGGNSGSPVLNANGELIGLNFDRAWEGTMSDINYDPAICRNITVDIRYVLFVIDKFANAQNIIKELTIVN